MDKLKEGELYLTVQILGKDGIKVAAFKNTTKKPGSNEPDFRGDGIAIWKNHKKPEAKKNDI